MCEYVFTSMCMYMCMFIMYIHFFFRELLAKHLPTHTVSNLPATPGHSLGPGLGDTGRLSLSILHFPKLQSSEMWKEAPPTRPPPCAPFHLGRLFSPFLLLPILAQTPVSRRQPWKVNHGAMEVLLWARHWARALPACSCPETLAAKRQFWRDYWHIWPSGLSGDPSQPHGG